MSGALAAADLMVRDGEPRVRDVRLGEVLGMAQPLNIRRVIDRNTDELRMHGPIHAAREKVQLGSGALREITTYHLNEAQAVLVCMFSRTEKAAEVRRQIIQVFIAWRRGALAPERARTVPEIDADRWAALEKRLARMERLIQFQGKAETPQFARAIAYAPPILTRLHDDGRRRWQRRPDFWGDLEVRQMVIETHRQMTLSAARVLIENRVGRFRCPSKSALQRAWQRLDAVRATH